MHGTAETLRPKSFKPKFGSYVSVTIGKPILFEEYNDKTWNTEDKEFFVTSKIITNKIMEKIQELCYETEKDLFCILERKLNKNLNEINLSDKQKKKLRKFLRRYSHYPPYTLLN